MRKHIYYVEIKIVLLLHVQVSLMLERDLFQFNLLVFCWRNAGGYIFVWGTYLDGESENMLQFLCSSVAVGRPCTIVCYDDANKIVYVARKKQLQQYSPSLLLVVVVLQWLESVEIGSVSCSHDKAEDWSQRCSNGKAEGWKSKLFKCQSSSNSARMLFWRIRIWDLNCCLLLEGCDGSRSGQPSQ